MATDKNPEVTRREGGSLVQGTPQSTQLQYATKHLTPQCKIVCYQWTTEARKFDTLNSELTKSKRLDVSSQVMECTFSKELGKPSGTFSFSLANFAGDSSRDWKDLLKRGMWCVIYMSQDGDLSINPKVGEPLIAGAAARKELPKIRCFGYIDRVSVSGGVGDSGELSISYEVFGRDFGVVYEDTTIWHNFFHWEEIMLQSIRSTSLNVLGNVTVDKAIDTVHDLFFFPKNVPGAKVNEEKSLVSHGLQWLLPRALLMDTVGFSAEPFWGAIPRVKEISTTAVTLSVTNPIDYLSGNAWEALKKISIPHLHELFLETDEFGVPKFVFRPIPFSLNQDPYPTAGPHITLYKDLDTISIPTIDVIAFDLGEDNHNRFNSFLLTLATSLIHKSDNITLLQNPDPTKKPDFPKNIKDSIKRHGFRPMHVSINAFVLNGELGNGIGNPKMVKEFNAVIEDYWRYSYLMESGTVTIIGNNIIKIGKALTFSLETPYISDKRYYIEGYTDTFSVGENGSKTWKTSVVLTRGLSNANINLAFEDPNSIKDARATEFKREGEFSPGGVI